MNTFPALCAHLAMMSPPALAALDRTPLPTWGNPYDYPERSLPDRDLLSWDTRDPLYHRVAWRDRSSTEATLLVETYMPHDPGYTSRGPADWLLYVDNARGWVDAMPDDNAGAVGSNWQPTTRVSAGRCWGPAGREGITIRHGFDFHIRSTVMDHIVVDVEIKKTIEETPGGWDATHLLGVSCAIVYEYQSDRFRVYGDSQRDLTELQQRLLVADRITGFNIYRFDFPCIWGLSRAAWDSDETKELRATLLPKTDDLLRRIWLSLGLNPDRWSNAHKGWSLDNVAGNTLGRGKIGYGGNAPKWYQAGDWGRLVNYCVDDVALERDLGAFIDRYQYVVGLSDERLLITAAPGK